MTKKLHHSWHAPSSTVHSRIAAAAAMPGLWLPIAKLHLLRFVVDLFYNVLYNKLYEKSTTNAAQVHIKSKADKKSKAHERRSLSTVGGTHSGQSTPPHYCPPLIHLHPPHRNGVKSHSRCGTESLQSLTKCNLALFRFYPKNITSG